MRRTTASAIRTRAAGLVAVVALVVMAAVGVPAVAAVPAVLAVLPPPPPGSVEVLPGDLDASWKVITDDALWATAGDVVYRRPLTVTDTSVTLGRAEAVARTAGSFAVHDGTLAYVRPVDGRVVLRASDGSEAIPDWGDDEAFRGGVWRLTERWVQAGFGNGVVLSRATGAALDLLSVSATPADSTDVRTGSVLVTDDRALWSATGARPGGYWSRVYTAALGPDGVVGPVTVLDEALAPSLMEPEVVTPATLSGTLVAWHHELADPTPGPQRTLSWYVGPPYTGAPQQLGADGTLPTYLGYFTGTQRVLVTATPGGDRYDWQDLTAADPSAVVRTVTLPVWVGATIHGPLIAYSDTIHSSGDPYESWFLDADGRPITADQRPPVMLPSFSDVRGYDTFADEILWLADHGVVGGYADGTFRGLAAINRDALAAFLYRAAHDGARAPGCPSAPFVDVPVSHPFCGEITWLVSAGVTTGWPDGTFRPASAVTREAMAAFLYRLAHDGADAPACLAAPFADVSVANPFCGAVAWLADAGITTGWPDGTFRPRLSIERQAMAAFLFRVIAAGLVPTPAYDVGPLAPLGFRPFPASDPWNTPIDGAAVDPASDVLIASIGASDTLHMDFGADWDGGPFGIPYVVVRAGQPRVAVTFGYDDESDPGPYPIPPNAPIEGGPDADGDRHVLVVDGATHLLYELYDAHRQADGSWHAGSGAVFNLDTGTTRPAGWTSADAAGLPILPGLVRYDEVAAGHIDHAIRFTVNDSRRAYVAPARHFASSDSSPSLPPMGMRVRLRADFDISGYPEQARVILEAMQTYGMILADNGSDWYVSGTPDPRWDDDQLNTLKDVPGSAFEVVAMGPVTTG